MKKNGFTLIELLAVITILSLIALVTSISVANMVKESKIELSSAQMKSIQSAAESWSGDNIDILPTGNNCTFITLNDLKEDGLLDSNITDPKNKNIISNDLKIKITSKLNVKGKPVLTYEVNPKDTKDCTYIGSSLYVEVPEGLTPVIYDKEKESWKVPGVNEEWYNYDKQMWANAVVLGKGKTKQPGELVSVEGNKPDALMMLVYIPRYEYKIEGQYGKRSDGANGTAALPGEIEVKFINNSQTKADNDYILHPAFNFDGAKSGFWVGKFELSHITKSQGIETNTSDYDAAYLYCSSDTCSETQNLRILPNVPSLRYNNVSNFFYAIRSIENTQSFGLNSIDTHMMKNSEWGAVAYLSQSKYGKYGNNDYDNKYREVYQNQSSSYITGSSNGTPSQDGSRDGGQCAYNDMQDLGKDANNYKMGQCGPGASTTGNIYGVYDMSGGSFEYVMGAYGTEYPTIQSSGFNQIPNVFTSGRIDPKYYDVYKTDYASTACDNNGICYGHALSETSFWYDDYAYMVTVSNPWLLCGGEYGTFTSAGVFSYINSSGSSDYDNSARVIAFGK